ncbi:MAG: short-chain fatty acid transporter, partial [Pseudomonadota bacterium]|nr:short-chain fatty acid transporter [Pseudomonadota bacterium]
MQVLTRFFTAMVQRYLPDPFVFAIILSIIVFAMSVLITPNSPTNILNMWGSGFWNLLGFTMQMVLVVVTGHALASSEVVKKILKSCATLPKNPTQGVMLVTFVGSIACIINWGFG